MKDCYKLFCLKKEKGREHFALASLANWVTKRILYKKPWGGDAVLAGLLASQIHSDGALPCGSSYQCSSKAVSQLAR